MKSWMRESRVSRRGLLGAGALAIAALGAGGAWPAQCRGKFYPGSHVFGVDLGGLPRSEATARLRDQLASFEAAAVTYSWESNTWAASVTELGVTIEYNATLDAAWRHGRDDGVVGRYKVLLDRDHQGGTVSLTVVIDEGKLERYLTILERRMDRAARDARLVVEGTDVRVMAEEPGVRLDRDAAQRETLAGLRRATPVEVTLRGVPVPPSIAAADLQPARRTVATLLGADVTVTLAERSWTVSPDDLALALVMPDDPVLDRARIDPDALDEVLSPIAAEVNHPPQNATVAWDGGLYVIEEGYAGVDVDLERLGLEVTAAAATDARSVDLPVTFIPPTVDATNREALGITNHLASGSSSYAGSSAARATNVQVAAELISRTLIPPDGTFSFNEALGPISPDQGYVEGKVISGDWYASDLGGGVCQISTTVFRAALLAGLPFTEWHPHSFRLGFYELDGWPPGMDAAIYQPNTLDEQALDLVFTNPTDAWLLLQLRIDGEALTTDLYGVPTGYEVEISQPALGEPIPPPEPIERPSEALPTGSREQLQTAQPGVDVVMTRRVVKDGTVLIEDTFMSPYQPQAEMWLIGLGDA